MYRYMWILCVWILNKFLMLVYWIVILKFIKSIFHSLFIRIAWFWTYWKGFLMIYNFCSLYFSKYGPEIWVFLWFVRPASMISKIEILTFKILIKLSFYPKYLGNTSTERSFCILWFYRELFLSILWFRIPKHQITQLLWSENFLQNWLLFENWYLLCYASKNYDFYHSWKLSDFSKIL